MKKEQMKQETRAKCAYVPPLIEVCAAEFSRLLATSETEFGGTHGDATFNGATGTHLNAIFNGATGTHGDATFGGGAGTHLDAIAGDAVGSAKEFFSSPWGE